MLYKLATATTTTKRGHCSEEDQDGYMKRPEGIKGKGEM